MNVYEDYFYFIKHHSNLINELEKKCPSLFLHLENSYKITEYFYNKSKEETLSEDEALFFQSGFNHLSEIIEFIELTLKTYLKNNYKTLNEISKCVGVYLDIQDFKYALSQENCDEGVVEFEKLETNILKFIEKRKNLTEELHNEFDNLTYTYEEILSKHSTVEEILWEIGTELGIIE